MENFPSKNNIYKNLNYLGGFSGVALGAYIRLADKYLFDILFIYYKWSKLIMKIAILFNFVLVYLSYLQVLCYIMQYRFHVNYNPIKEEEA